MPGALKLKKAEHLRSPREFRQVYERRCSVSDRWLIVYGNPNELTYLRLGLSVSRKVGNAVQRNRFRRLYREAFRLTRPLMPTGLDLILIPRGTNEPQLDDVKTSLTTLVKKLAHRLLPK